MKLRDYQEDCSLAILDTWREHDRSLVVMPTGTGKTVVCWDLISRWREQNPDVRGLVLAHREELIRQFADKGRDFEVVADIEMASHRAAEKTVFKAPPIVVASVQTLISGSTCMACHRRVELALGEWKEENPHTPHPGVRLGCDQCIEGRVRRMQRFARDAFGFLIVDEAHHAVANSYQMIFDYFKVTGGPTKLLGVTATPDRHDEETLGQIFENVAYEYQLPSAISDGYLVPIEQQYVQVEGLDLSKCATKRSGGDLQDKDVADAMSVLQEERRLHEVVGPTIELAGDRQTLVFAASVELAQWMAEIFNRHAAGSAEVLHGGTDSDIRRQTLQRFRRREFQYLINCALFLEGFDAPTIGCVAVARPTASRALYAQIVGRGTRPLPGLIDGLATPESRRQAIADSDKPSVLVLDYVGNSGRHKLVTTADLLGGQESDRVVAVATSIAKERSERGPQDMESILEEARRKVEEEDAARREAERRRGVTPKATFSTREVNPFSILDVLPPREPGWHKGRKASERQKAALRRFGVDDSTVANASFVEATKMLDSLIERVKKQQCTLKQAKILRRHGFGIDVSVQEASATIDRIAASQWKLRGDG